MKNRKPTKEQLRRLELVRQFRAFAKKHGFRCAASLPGVAYKSAFLTATDVHYKDFDHTTTFDISICGGVKAIGDNVYRIAEPAKDCVDEKGWIAALDTANEFLASKGGKWWNWEKGAFEDPQCFNSEVPS